MALFAISAPALAAFVRLLMFQDIAQAPANALPSWLNDLSAYRLLFTKDANSDGAIEASELFVARDGIVLALPMAAKLPFVCTVLTAAAGLAIALAAAASHLFTLAGSLADDVIRLVDPRSEVLPRLMVAWVAIAATALAAGVFLAFAEIDVMQVAIMAFASPRRFSSRCCFSPSGGDAALGSAPCLPLASASPPWLPQWPSGMRPSPVSSASPR